MAVDPAAFRPFDLGAILQQGQQRQMQQAQLQAFQGQEQRRQQLGELLPAALQGDEKALAGVFSADANVGMQLEQRRREQQAQRWARTAPHAYRARQLPPEQRQAYVANILPQLRQLGWSDEELAQIDLTDQGLDALITSGQSLEQAMQQDAIDWQIIPQVGAFAVDARGRPVNPSATGSVPQAGGIPGAQPQSAPQAAPQGGQTIAAGNPYAQGVASTLSAAGLPTPVIAGILANGEQESGWNPAAVGDGGTAHGPFQWRGERAENFQRVTGAHPSQATPEQTAQFVLHELQNPEQAGMTRAQAQAILSARTPQQAAILFSQYYERPSARHANNARRAQLAAQYAGGAPQAAPGQPQRSLQEQAASGVIMAPPRAPDDMILNPDGSLTPRVGSQAEFQRQQSAQQNTREAQRDIATLNREFRSDPEVRQFNAARTATMQIRTLGGSGSPSDDIAIVFTFMKALDPNSTVREGEFATAQSAAGIPDRVRSWYNQMLQGTRLTPQQRQQMIATAGRMYTDRARVYNEHVQGYREQAVAMGIPPERVGRMFQTARAPAAADRQRQQPRGGGRTSSGVRYRVRGN